MADLSPVAQAVFEAAWTAYWPKDAEQPADAELIAAAAISAAVDKVVPLEQKTPWGSVVQAHAAGLRIRNELLAIVDELEGAGACCS